MIELQLTEKNRKYILLSIVCLIIGGIVIAKFMGKSQDEQFANEDNLYVATSSLVSEGKYTEATQFIGELLKDKKVSVKVVPSRDKWFGVTYKEDKPFVVESFKKLIESGAYNKDLFSDL